MNADLSQRASVATSTVPWSSRGGIEEKLLEDSSLQGLRRTAVLRIPPGGQLPVIGTTGSIDLLVLEGELRDPRFVYRAGMFLHEPAGARAFHTTTGCLVLLKQRPARRVTRRSLDISGVAFEVGQSPGLWNAPLHEGLDGKVVLLRFDPGTVVGTHRHDDGEEFFVLRGEVRDDHGTYRLHDWVRQPPASVHSIESPGGCLFFTFAHHLPL